MKTNKEKLMSIKDTLLQAQEVARNHTNKAPCVKCLKRELVFNKKSNECVVCDWNTVYLLISNTLMNDLHDVTSE